MQVKKSYLIIAAGCMWMTAGINVFHIGFQVWDVKRTMPWLHFFGVIATFFFFATIFNRVYKKNVTRILKMDNLRNPFLFFDARGWLIMAFMISLGVTVRHFELLPAYIIAAFYQGMGACLAIFGGRFLWTGAMTGS
jgi:hypothetical protein